MLTVITKCSYCGDKEENIESDDVGGKREIAALSIEAVKGDRVNVCTHCWIKVFDTVLGARLKHK
mgnify:CR=1 FL=1